MKQIKVNNISYSYDNSKHFAISDISTTITNNEFVAIIGHTGSGKSTFIQNLNGLITPTKGEVIVDETVIKNKGKISNIKSLRKTIGIVFQFPEYQLFEETVAKDIAFGPKNFNYDVDELDSLVSNALKAVGLDDSFKEKSPFELSGGEKRRVAIADILAFEPDVLVVDEPTAGLDPISATNMLELFNNLYKGGKSVVLVTHNMDDVLKYASRVLVFKDGSLVYDNKPSKLFSDENKVKELGLELPSVSTLVNKLASKYPKLKEYEIKDVDDFVKVYKEVSSL